MLKGHDNQLLIVIKTIATLLLFGNFTDNPSFSLYIYHIPYRSPYNKDL